MAHRVDVTVFLEEFRDGLSRSFQSGHINFLLGSGASAPSIPIAGKIEQQIADCFIANRDDEARDLLYDFVVSLQEPTNRMLDETLNVDDLATLEGYSNFLSILETLLSERRTNLLPKQATVFTTNYDLFVERASLDRPVLRLNDGFSRAPSLKNHMEFSSRNFFSSTYNTGNLYSYEVEIPSLNLVKLHGSLSWRAQLANLIFQVERRDFLPLGRTAEQVEQFVSSYSIVLPAATKFRTTVMDRHYYDLLRMYANELDRENALLVVFGFSFADEHVFDITLRALRNPTLRMLVFAFQTESAESYLLRFARNNNVHVVSPPIGEQIDFARFNTLLRSSLPVRQEMA